MSLFATTVTVWNTKKAGNRMNLAYSDEFLINTNRIIDLTVVGDDDTQFCYADDPDDRRDSPGFIECVTSKAAIEAYHNGVADSKLAELDIFPGFDNTATPETIQLEWDCIAYIWQTRQDIADDVSHMVYYEGAWKRVLCLIDHTPLEVLTLQNLT